IQRQAQPVKRVEAVVAADGEKASGVEAAIENVRCAVANPVEVRLSGTVFKGKHKQQPPARRGLRSRFGRGYLATRESGERNKKGQNQDREELSESKRLPHTRIIVGAHWRRWAQGRRSCASTAAGRSKWRTAAHWPRRCSLQTTRPPSSRVISAGSRSRWKPK